jgi:2-keto-4-pentenoate hydratase
MEAPTASISACEEDRMRQAAEVLLKARRTYEPIDDLPEGLRPNSLEEAYALQDLIAEALGPIGGWKVGALSPEATPKFGPMPLLGGFARSGDVLAADARRMRGIEAEIAFLVGRDLPPRAHPYTREEVADAMASAHPAIELLESAYDDPDKVATLSMVGDLQMNGGFVHGSAVADWREFDFAGESVVVSVDGVVRYEGTASNPAGTDLLRLVTFLANEGSARTGGLRAGQWVTTGSWSGKTCASKGSSAVVRFAHCGEVYIQFE